MELSIACGAAGGAGRTSIMSSVAELRKGFFSSLDSARDVELGHHLEKR